MTQKAKIIDVKRGYVVVDPNAFPENMMHTQKEDSPEEPLPILPYEGYNFLPTAYGYKSYFGTNSTLDIAGLLSRCDEVLLYQFTNYMNILIALCEDGIWVARPSATGNVWTQAIAMAVPAPAGTYKAWTYAVIANRIYFYRQGGTAIHYITPEDISNATPPVVTINTLIPSVTTESIGAGGAVVTTITSIMTSDMMGIFRANGRMGMWNASNGVFWSAFFDLTDFTDNGLTQAGFSTFAGVLGRITTIKPQGEGFVIYCTKSIVGVRYAGSADNLWDASIISDVAGILYPFQVTRGLSELELLLLLL